jgi:hypothetical protein
MRLTLAIVALLSALPAAAQEPVGCDKFKWPLDKERTLLAAAAPVTAGRNIGAPLANAYKLALAPADQARLPMPPTRAPKPNTMAGFVNLAAPPKPGIYRLTLSDAGWVDVFQDGVALKSFAFSGAIGCAGLRKSVKFNLATKPIVVELSGATATSISFVITPD